MERESALDRHAERFGKRSAIDRKKPDLSHKNSLVIVAVGYPPRATLVTGTVHMATSSRKMPQDDNSTR